MVSPRRLYRAGINRLIAARKAHPYTLALGLVLPVSGVLAVVLGDRVSRALSIIVADDISRGMGAALLIGSILILFGTLRKEPIVEVSGLVFLAMGCSIYSLGVVLGLGLGGMVAGPGFFAIALGTVFRVMNFTAAVRAAEKPRHRIRR